MVTLVASVAVVVLAAVLVLAATIGSLRGVPRSGWLSFAGGVAVTYVFLKLLPELAPAQQKFEAHHPSGGWLGEHRLFLFSLAGATVGGLTLPPCIFAVRGFDGRGQAPRGARAVQARVVPATSAAW